MSARTLVNVIAVTLFAVAATFVGAVVMKSGAPQEEREQEQRRTERLAEAEADAKQEAARVASLPPRTTNSGATTSSRPAASNPSAQNNSSPSSPAQQAQNEAIREKIVDRERLATAKLDPGRVARRTGNEEARRLAIRALLAFRLDPVKEKADAVEEAVEKLRKLPSDFRDYDKPLAQFYDPLNKPIVAMPNPDKPGEVTGEEILKPTKAEWEEYFQFLEKWQELRPDTVTPLVIRAQASIHYAWEARGGGYADSVTEESWELYGDRIREALKALKQADETGKQDVEYYRQMIIAIKAAGGNRQLAYDCIEKGRKLFPDYWELYEAAADYFLPRWHGYPGEVEELANRLQDDLGGDMGKIAFFRIAYAVHHYDPQTVVEGKYEPEKLNAAATAMMKHHPLLIGYVRFALASAWVTEDFELAERCRGLLDGEEIFDRVILGNAAVHNGVQSFLGKQPPKNAVAPDIKRRQRGPVHALAFFADGIVTTSYQYNAPLQFFRGAEFAPGGKKPMEGSACTTLLTHTGGQRLFHDVVDEDTTHATSFWRDRREQPVLFDAVHAKNLRWAWSPDEKYVIGADTKAVFVWNANSGAKEREFPLGYRPRGDVFFTADGQRLVVRRNFEVCVYDFATGENVLTAGEKEGEFRCYDLAGRAADGRLLFNGKEVKQAGAKARWFYWTPGEPFSEPICVAESTRSFLSADSRLLVWTERTPAIATVVFDLEKAQEVGRFPQLNEPISGAVSPDNAWLALGFGDGGLRLWKLPEAVRGTTKPAAREE